MPTVTLRDFPLDLYEFLMADTSVNERSINKHLIVILEAYRQQVLAQRDAVMFNSEISGKKSVSPL